MTTVFDDLERVDLREDVARMVASLRRQWLLTGKVDREAEIALKKIWSRHAK